MEATEITKFAPAERASDVEVQRQLETILDIGWVKKLYDAITEFVLVLNEYRQIVFANQPFIELLSNAGIESIIGLRPGEALQCKHAKESKGGCGTTEYCRECGAVLTIMLSQKDISTIQECRIIQENGEALDLQVRASRLILGDEKFTVFTSKDISNEKRREVMERIFFHDIMNIVSNIREFIETMEKTNHKKAKEYNRRIYKNVIRLAEEIEGHRILTAAERNELYCNITKIDSIKLIKTIAGIWEGNKLANELNIKLSSNSEKVIFTSDKTILSRILSNMVKNALEACNPGDTVTIGCRKNGGKIEFWVHNQTYIPREVQLRIFQRSFSTKGTGRGLGTYSMKLLSERYLKGNVFFTTSLEDGTTFTVSCPAELDKEINYQTA
jgi:signal transduction histidine kinase